jgi:hypothetical protein
MEIFSIFVVLTDSAGSSLLVESSLVAHGMETGISELFLFCGFHI